MTRKTKRLNFILTRNVVLVGLGISILVAGVRVSLLLDRTVGEINERTGELFEAVTDTAAQAAYAVDEALAAKAVAGLFYSPYVRSVKVVDDFGSVLFFREKQDDPGPSLWLDLFGRGWRGSYDIPLSAYDTPVGHLIVKMNDHMVASEIRSLMFSELAGGAAMFLLLAGILILVFYVSLTRPLVLLERSVSAVDPDNPSAGEIVVPERHHGDEIGSLARAFNSLLGRMSRGMRHLKATRDELEAREAHFRSLFENTGTAIIVINAEGVVTSCNRMFETLTGWDRAEVEGRERWTRFVARDDQERMAGYRRDRMGGGPTPPREYEFVLVTKSGDRRVCNIQVGILPGGTDLVAALLDVTESRRDKEALLEAKQQAEEANRSKSEFLANMSHEIRTPLNGILGMLQVIEDTKLDEEQIEFVQAGIHSTLRLTRLLSDILDLSRVEAGKLAIQCLPFDPHEVVRQTCELYRSVASQSGLGLECDLDPDIPQLLLGDSIRVQQVLNNLVGNAFKFTARGKITVAAHLVHRCVGGRCVVLFTVRDTGVGISEKDMSRLFEAFTQADNSLSRRHQGAGLGLAISRHLLELMDGHLSVESEVGRGTEFCFGIPFGRTERASSRPRPRPDPGDAKEEPLAVRKVLVAEDERINRISLVRLLEHQGLDVSAVSNGREALSALMDHDFDMVFMDVQMPVLNGVEATRAVRDGVAGERNRDMPIVAMTAYAMVGDRERFLEQGMNGYLAKPVELDVLLKTLADFPARHGR